MVVQSAALPITASPSAAPSAPRRAQPGGPRAPSAPSSPAGRAGPTRPPQARPSPPRCGCCPRGAPQPLRGGGAREPSAPTRTYPSRRAPGASMFLVTAGGGVRAASREPALQSRGRRVRSARPPPAAAPRHAAPHLARPRTRVKGADRGRSPRGTRPPRWPPGGVPGPPPHRENTPSSGGAQLTNQNLVEGSAGCCRAGERGAEVEERSGGAPANIMK